MPSSTAACRKPQVLTKATSASSALPTRRNPAASRTPPRCSLSTAFFGQPRLMMCRFFKSYFLTFRLEPSGGTQSAARRRRGSEIPTVRGDQHVLPGAETDGQRPVQRKGLLKAFAHRGHEKVSVSLSDAQPAIAAGTDRQRGFGGGFAHFFRHGGRFLRRGGSFFGVRLRAGILCLSARLHFALHRRFLGLLHFVVARLFRLAALHLVVGLFPLQLGDFAADAVPVEPQSAKSSHGKKNQQHHAVAARRAVPETAGRQSHVRGAGPRRRRRHHGMPLSRTA